MRKPENNPHTILVVDDNAVLRMHSAELLKEAGYLVVEAPDVATALSHLASRPEIRLLFTDVQMPGGNDGLFLVQKVREQWPHVLLLITSGGAKVSDESIPHEARFLTKPYSDREVVGHIAAMISG